MLNIFAYRKPNEKKIYCGSSNRTLTGINPHSFVIYPFDGMSQSTPISIPYDNDFEMEELNGLMDRVREEENAVNPDLFFSFPEKSTSKKEHEKSVEEITQLIKRGELSKCVLAKVIVSEGKLNIFKTFLNLCEFYPDAFIFFFHTSGSGTWMGASPELLLSRKDNRIETMALAGTKPAKSEKPWDKKNIEEHNVVTEFITRVLNDYEIDIQKEESKTVNAGPVEHLMTSIKGKLKKEIPLEDLVYALSPTPALCGFPRDKAFELIAKVENFERGFYGGFCGWVDDETDFRFYVNIRSMLIEKGRYCIFSGGGIMGDSKSGIEWTETENKAGTILSRIEISHN